MTPFFAALLGFGVAWGIVFAVIATITLRTKIIYCAFCGQQISGKPEDHNCDAKIIWNDSRKILDEAYRKFGLGKPGSPRLMLFKPGKNFDLGEIGRN